MRMPVRPHSADVDHCRFSVLNQQQFLLMGRGTAGGPWDFPRVEDRIRAVNFTQSLGPVPSGSRAGSVDGQLGEIRLALDGHDELLPDVLMSTSGCDAAAEIIVGSREEEEFGGAAGSPSAISNHILQRGTSNSSALQQQLFAASRGLVMTSSAFIQQLTRSPNHGIRNLFPEKSSNFSSPVLPSHEDLGGDNVGDEQALLHLSKKVKRQDFGEGGSLSSPVSHTGVDHASRLNHGDTASQYRKAPFAHDQHSNSLASLLDRSCSYNKSSTTSFSASFPSPADRPTAFNSTISALPNRSASLSSFQTSGGPLLPQKNSHESLSVQAPLVSYGSFPLESRMQGGGGFSGELLLPERDSFLDSSNSQTSRNYMALGGSLGQAAFNFASRRQSCLDSGGRAAWPAGLINNIPSLSMESSSGIILPSRRTLHDPEQPDGLLEDSETRRIHSISESRRRLLIQKQLTTTDVGSLGRIILPKKEAETYLPHLPDKEGIEMYMFDYEAERTWTMKYRFWPNNKSRMYLLENTGEFAKFHSLQQGDWLYIYREPLARYVLRAKKTPPLLLSVTPSSQSVTESAAAGRSPAAEDVGGPASSLRRTMNLSPSGGGSSTSTDMLCGTITASASCKQLSLDVPSSPFSLSGGAVGAAKCSGQVVEGKHPVPHHRDQVMLETSNTNGKHPVHQLQAGPRVSVAKASTVDDDGDDDDQQEHRLKNYMAVQQQQANHEMPSELDGGGEFNLEDFPRLSEADDEIIENFLG